MYVHVELQDDISTWLYTLHFSVPVGMMVNNPFNETVRKCHYQSSIELGETALTFTPSHVELENAPGPLPS